PLKIPLHRKGATTPVDDLRHTWFFTDSDDAEYQEKTNGHMINTNCSSSHNRKALCCKMSVEFDVFLESISS
ncbi:hypothetical protein L9F63_016718, partial [Diploptera punctata]